MKSTQLIVALSFGTFASWAVADTYVRLNISSDGLGRQISESSNPSRSMDSLSLGPSSGAAYADAATGILTTSAVAPPGTHSLSIALAQASDDITFSDGAAGTAFLDWSLAASLGPYAHGLDSQAQLAVSLDGALYAFVLDNYNCDFSDFTGGAPTSCTVGVAIDTAGSLPFAIHAGITSVSATLEIAGANGAAASFDGAVQLYLRTPDGVSYTSFSGPFLNAGVPITAAVPEPQTYALLLAGLAMTPMMLRRRRRQN